MTGPAAPVVGPAAPAALPPPCCAALRVPCLALLRLHLPDCRHPLVLSGQTA